MKGRELLIQKLPLGGFAAALRVDGQLEDLLIDPPETDLTPRPGAIYVGQSQRQIKSLGASILDLGHGHAGLLRGTDQPKSGERQIVQVSGYAEPAKAPPLTDRIRLKGRLSILTPGRPGSSVAKSIKCQTRRADLTRLASAAMGDASQGCGVIVRSQALSASDNEIIEEIKEQLVDWARITDAHRTKSIGLLRRAPNAKDYAYIEWSTMDDMHTGGENAFAETGMWEEISALLTARSPLPGGAFIWIEPTHGFVSVDVNTGGDTSPAAALKANLSAVGDLPKQLRLRGLGGQVIVDLAPLAKAHRPRLESALKSSLRKDSIETTVAGWTPLGNLELLRKRDRFPLTTLRSQIDTLKV